MSHLKTSGVPTMVSHKKQFLSSIPEIDLIDSSSTMHPQVLHPQNTIPIPIQPNSNNASTAAAVIKVKGWKSLESYWYILLVFFGMLLVYAFARIISLQRRVRDLEARPPVDDITLRGAVRLQLNDLVSDLEQSLRAKESSKDASPNLNVHVKDHHVKDKDKDVSFISSPPVTTTRQIDAMDEEMNQVMEIAKSVKSSLPDLKMFANAMKQQRNVKSTVPVQALPSPSKQVRQMDSTHDALTKDTPPMDSTHIYAVMKDTTPKETQGLHDETILDLDQKNDKTTTTNDSFTQENIKVDNLILTQETKQDEKIEIENKEDEVKVSRWSTPLLKKEKEKKLKAQAAPKRLQNRRGAALPDADLNS